MRYYKQVKIKSFGDLSMYFELIHLSPFDFAVYFDAINLFRVFSDSEVDLSKIMKDADILLTPEECKYVCCVRNRDAERGTENQQNNRLTKLKAKFKKEGRVFSEDMVMMRNKKSHYYVNMKSHSNGRSFRLGVRSEVKCKQKIGIFSSYGLSLNGSTVPLF